MSGGVGSGKTISAVRQAIVEARKNMVLTNFRIKGLKNHHRLKKGDILVEQTNDKGVIKDYSINWEFWEEHKNCDIFLDETDYLINSRNSMSKKSQRYSQFFAQIRKIWGQSGDQNHIESLRKMNNNAFNRYHRRIYSLSNNIYFITQKPRKIDINVREISHVHIQCRKKVMRDGRVIIFQHHYLGNDNISGIEMMEAGVAPKVSYFIANSYFGRYDSYEIIKGEYL